MQYFKILLFLWTVSINAQSFLDEPEVIDPRAVVHWKVIQGELLPKQKAEIEVELTIEQNFTLYTDHVEFKSSIGMFPEVILTPTPLKKIDPITNEEMFFYSGGTFKVRFNLPSGEELKEMDLGIKYIACSSKLCLMPFTETLTVSFQKPLQGGGLGETTQLVPPRNGPQSFWLLLWLALLGGLLTNLTPCVYPMVPITLRILYKLKMNPKKAAFFYALGIFISYSALGIFAALTQSLFGSLLASPWFNLFFAGLMLFMGASMLFTNGLGFHKLQNLGYKIKIPKLGVVEPWVMGMVAGLVAAPCTGPIMATILTYSVGLNAKSSILLFMSYSLGFALPYWILGSLVQKVTSIKVHPKLGQFVKVFFALVMFGLSAYYMRVPYYSWFEKPRFESSVIVESYESPVLLDMWAEWCESCKQMDAITFKDEALIKFMKDHKWNFLKIDLTLSNEKNEAIMKQYKVMSLPTLVLIRDPKKPEEFERIHGLVSAEELIQTLSKSKN